MTVRPRPQTHYKGSPPDRKSTRLNSSHSQISYAVFCLKKKIQEDTFAWGESAKASADKHIATGGCKVYWAPCSEVTSSPQAFAKCEGLEVELDDSAIVQ